MKATQRVDAPLVGLDLAPYLHDEEGVDEAIYDCIAVLVSAAWITNYVH